MREYLDARVALMKYHRLDGFSCEENKSLGSRSHQSYLLLKVVRENLLCLFPTASGGLLAISALWQRHPDLCLFLYMAFSLGACLSPNFSVV